MRAHNQYLLFDFSNIVPEFFIDEQLYDQMTFRETLLVSTFANMSESPVPTPVGGICIDVQKAKGRGPLVRRDPAFEQELIEALTWKHEVGNTKDTGNWTETCKTCEENKSASTYKSHRSKKCPNSKSDDPSQESVKIEPTPSQLRLLEYELGIGNSMQRTQCKFLIHQSSQFYVNDMNAGSLLTSWVDKNFHTLEEKRTEFLVEKDGTVKEKMLFVALQKGKYYVKTHSTVDDSVEKKFYSFRVTKNFVSEGANYVLMRYLAITRYIGEFELSSMYINGTMCRNIYKCTGPEVGIVNDKKIDVCKIYRTLIEECGLTHNSITVISLNGQIIKQEWEECDYILQVNPFAQIKRKQKPGKLERIYLKHVWENDMELFSRYLDRKEQRHLKLIQYLKDHQELKNILSDYLSRILIMKPTEVIDFTVDYFKQYAPVVIPREEYFGESEEESVRYEESVESTISMLPEEEEEKDAHVQAIQYLISLSDSCICEGVCLCDEETPESAASCICEEICECFEEEEEEKVEDNKQPEIQEEGMDEVPPESKEEEEQQQQEAPKEEQEAPKEEQEAPKQEPEPQTETETGENPSENQ
ncbi:ciliogenesis-associated TTC17-interacting protein-like [Agrilus planipennis]|nr:ciliogenesis-associated TTC17-interacting protein-like [Agrilus planipennis]